MEARVAQVRAEHESTNARLQDKRERLRECDAAVQRLRGEQSALQAQLSDCSVDRKKLEHKQPPPPMPHAQFWTQMPCCSCADCLALPRLGGSMQIQGVKHPARRGPVTLPQALAVEHAA